jgi:hypothetical protein
MFKNLSQIQKKLLAGLLSFVIVAGTFGTYFYISTNKLKNLEIPEPAPKGPSEVVLKGKKALQNLQETVKDVNPEKLLFTEVTLEQLNIYPKNWVTSTFSKEQRENSLITSAEADPDLDGLPNLKEFLYGSNPNKAYTFCGEKKENCPFNDKQMIDSGKSPLTGLVLELPKSFRLKRVDEKIIQGMKESFGATVAQGLDFPKLYEQARTLDLTADFQKIQVVGVKDNRESMINFFEKRVQSLKEFAQEDELTTFTNVYKILEVDKIKEIQKQYREMLASIEKIPVPDTFVDFQRANIFILNKLIQITDHRIEVIGNSKYANPEEVEKSQKMAKELFWGYRKMSEEQLKVQKKLDPNSAQ